MTPERGRVEGISTTASRGGRPRSKRGGGGVGADRGTWLSRNFEHLSKERRSRSSERADGILPPRTPPSPPDARNNRRCLAAPAQLTRNLLPPPSSC